MAKTVKYKPQKPCNIVKYETIDESGNVYLHLVDGNVVIPTKAEYREYLKEKSKSG